MVTESEGIVDLCAQVLSALEKPKCWMTAHGLAARLKGSGLSVEAIRIALIEYSALEVPRIRYCMYPGRNSLDVLWGHVDVVGRRRLYPLQRENLGEEIAEWTTPEKLSITGQAEAEPAIFLSHNHQDVRSVLALRDTLSKCRYKVWVFEDGISIGDIIIDAVRRQIASRRSFVAFVSDNYLGSLWCEKELDQIPAEHPVTFVIDGNANLLLDLFRKLSFDHSTLDSDMSGCFTKKCAKEGQALALLQRIYLRLATQSSGAYMFPWPRNWFPWPRDRAPWHGAGKRNLQFRPVTELHPGTLEN